MRVLVITKIFPNAAEPAFAPYNRQQFAALGRRCEVEVLGLVPWFPGAGLLQRFAPGRRRLDVPAVERIDGLVVKHPRVAYVPRIGRAVAGWTYAASLLPTLGRQRGRWDVLLGSFAYPDGWAAVALARLLGVPGVIKVHGSDVNVISTMPSLRPALSWALTNAAAVVAPSRALMDLAIELGAEEKHATVVMNGVDTELFHLRDREQARAALDQPTAGRVILFVGRIEPQKGVMELIEAFAEVARSRPDLRLVLVGGGVAQDGVAAVVASRQLPVVLAGECSHEEVAQWVGACDVLTLPSWAEGTPNVVLEALMSGRRVVATDVGGIPAVVDRPVLGELVPPRDATALAEALARAVDEPYAPDDIVAAVSFGGWQQSAGKLYDVLEQAVQGAGGRGAPP